MNKIELTSLLSDRALTTPAGRLVRALREHGGMSSAELARTTGLAKSTVSMTLADLRKSGIVVESVERAAQGGVGRPSTRLTLNPNAGSCIGILLGLRHIQVILADVSHAVLSDTTTVMEEDYTTDEALSVVRNAVRTSYASQGLSIESLLGVGVAAAGPVNPRDGRLLRASGLPTWVGVSLPELFGQLFDRPIYVDNESNCSALAEMMWGAAMGVEDFVIQQ